jgi:hypothetical protein
MYLNTLKAFRQEVFACFLQTQDDLHPKKWSPQRGELAHRLLVAEGTQILERGMPSDSIIKRFDVIKGHTPCLCSCLK